MMIELPRPPLHTDDYITMAEALDWDMEAYGKLVLALMIYTKYGTLPEGLPANAQTLFPIYRVKIDFARKKYENKCNTNAQNGSKGGKAKAANAAKAQLLPPNPPPDAAFKPPSEAQFMAVIQGLVDREEIPKPTKKAAKALFTEFQTNGWTIRGEPIRFMDECNNAIFYRFFESDELPQGMNSDIYETIFSNFHGLRKPDGKSGADMAECLFADRFDTAREIWTVNGTQYPLHAWADALADFMATYEV